MAQALVGAGCSQEKVSLSAPTTTVRGENYESGHVTINKGTTHKMRIFSMTSTVSHSSKAQLAHIKFQITAISTLYKQYHAADVKKLGQLFESWRNETSRILLGYEEIQRIELPKIVEIVREIAAKNLEEVGGTEAWSKLSDDQKDILTKSLMDTLAYRIGDEVFDQLPPEVRCEIELFFWVRCSMHKELNCCIAFEKGMRLYYEGRPESERPVLLANRDNDVTIQLAEEGGKSTAAVRRALKVSERGAIKLISLFGALVNHKDDKKGLHDVYENYFRPAIGAGIHFPDTSNTRYQSHRRGGAQLLAYLEEHRTFMDFVKDQKSKRTLNHMEQNIVKGINCPRMIAQMIAFLLFCMAVMHPYALQVRGPGTENLNMLDLGPLHDSVKAHMHKLIDNLRLLLSDAPDSYKLATLDGKPWRNKKVWAAGVQLAPTHIDVVPLISAGLKAALDCFERFTEEFAKGGQIDTATPAGGNFLAFMDEVVNTDEDHQFLRQEARQIDESGIEKARQAELNAHKQQVVNERCEKDAEKAEKAQKETEHLTAIGIEPVDHAEVEKMTDPKLKDQLELHRCRGDKEIPMKSHMKNKGERLAALLAAIGPIADDAPSLQAVIDPAHFCVHVIYCHFRKVPRKINLYRWGNGVPPPAA
ncbi:hypothetical protein MSAN_00226200 [Mycena sanguinolenta]|uniref:Uncharacterized protein n=1 Tax=Mycena sanguinolenta TaxID=230812 RepID=A0A8H6ZFG0_9AGAR|nr:hypothetical protein MSAN_00226200 [Mycena sanguinolenta]